MSSGTRERRDIRASYGDGAAFSLMIGFGETYLAAFALAVGLSELAAGLLSSVPLIAGGLLQLAGPWAARRIGSYRAWVLCCAAAQSLVYVPLALAAWHGRIDAWVLFVLAALYWGAGMAAGPAWNNWIDATIPKPRLREFLAVRSRITQLAACVAFLIGGVTLHLLAVRRQELLGFTSLFAAAGVCRLVSVGFLARQSDVPVPKNTAPEVSLKVACRRFREPQTGRFLLFLLASQVSISVASPYFSPYMLGFVRFNYAEYVAIVSTAFVAKILLYPAIARFVRHVGAYRALWLAALAVAPPPLFWILTPSLGALLVLQLVAGAAWAVFELASTLLIFDRIAPEERLRILTIYNLLNASALVVGSAIGGLALHLAATGDAGYRVIFYASAAFRLLSLAALFGLEKITVRFRALAFRTVGLRASRGSLALPILLDDEPEQGLRQDEAATPRAVSGTGSVPAGSSPRRYPPSTDPRTG